MGRMVYLPTSMVDFDGKLVGKYASPMDAIPYGPCVTEHLYKMGPKHPL